MFSFNYWSTFFSCVDISDRPTQLIHSSNEIFLDYFILFYDVNRKIAFRCSYEEIETSGEGPYYSFDGKVNMESFWGSLELDIAGKSFSKSADSICT